MSKKSDGRRSSRSISSPAASPANPSRLPGSSSVERMTAGSGPSLDGAFGSYDPVTSSLRTFQVSLLTEERESLETLPPAGTMRNGRLFQRQPLVPRTSGTGSFSSADSEGHQAEFPTPASTAYGSSGNAGVNNTVSAGRPSLEQMAARGLWPTPQAHDTGRTPEAHMEAKKNMPGGPPSKATSLSVMVKGAEKGMWPTPTAQDAHNDAGPSQWERNSDPLNVAVKRWPTPTAGEWQMFSAPKSSPSGPDYARAGREESGGDDLATQVARGTPGQLNPTWVEWLMGFPLGWTDCERSETP